MALLSLGGGVGRAVLTDFGCLEPSWLDDGPAPVANGRRLAGGGGGGSLEVEAICEGGSCGGFAGRDAADSVGDDVRGGEGGSGTCSGRCE